MVILGIETSCDETAAAVVEDGTKILANVVASSVELHKKTGGIIPEVAAREQIRCIIPVIENALKDTKILGYYDTRRLKKEKSLNILVSRYPNIIDAIAVTVGPGLIGSLLVGVETAKTLAWIWNKPIIPVNHLIAHIYANWLSSPAQLTPDSPPTSHPHPQFPLIALVVSGGHTDLVLMKNHGKIKWLGGTRDDAAGECFDKCARVLGLGYPGGPAIAATAAKLQITNYKLQIKLPRPMIEEKNFDFSFSGLKTAVIREVSRVSKVSQVSKELSFEIQEAITDVLVEKTIRAAGKFKVKSILLAGGVAANSRLREKFQSHPLITNYQLLIPQPQLCTDNAAYVSSFAHFNFKPIPWRRVTVKPGLEITQ